MYKKIYDISAPIYEGMPVYKNKPEKQPKLEILQDFDTGSVRETRVQLDCHTGTHVDSPLHMLAEGSEIFSIPLEKLIRPCRVLDFTSVKGEITATDIKGKDVKTGDFLLFKTQNSFEDIFNFEFVFLAKDGAEYLADMGIAGVGIDALGIERNQSGHPTHRTLFAKEIIIIEGLRLQEVPEGNYFMVAAPIKLIGTEAAPARVLLFDLMNEI